MEAIIYARFSPRRNEEDCESIETQLDRCRAYCQANDLTITAEFRDEAISGARADNRPGLQSALDAVCESKSVLVVYSLSRLARNTKDAIDIADRLNKAGADLASLHEKIDTTSAMGRFTFKLMSALAELEREQIAERTQDDMLRHQEIGRVMSKVLPYGWKLHPYTASLMIPCDEERAIIKRIVSYRHAEMGLREICRTLEQRGFLCRGNKWHHTTVKKILKREGLS